MQLAKCCNAKRAGCLKPRGSLRRAAGGKASQLHIMRYLMRVAQAALQKLHRRNANPHRKGTRGAALGANAARLHRCCQSLCKLHVWRPCKVYNRSRGDHLVTKRHAPGERPRHGLAEEGRVGDHPSALTLTGQLADGAGSKFEATFDRPSSLSARV